MVNLWRMENGRIRIHASEFGKSPCLKAIRLMAENPDLQYIRTPKLPVDWVPPDPIEAPEQIKTPRNEKLIDRAWNEYIPVDVAVGPLLIKGRIDSLYVEEGRPQVLLEYKADATWEAKPKARRPAESMFLQAQLYGFLLGKLGMDVTRLVIGVVVTGVWQGSRADGDFVMEMIQDEVGSDALHHAYALRDSGDSELLANTSLGAIALRTYDPSAISSRLDAMVSAAEDPQISPQGATKKTCRGCPFNAAELCNEPLDAPSENFRTHRRADGKLIVYRHTASYQRMLEDRQELEDES